MMMIFVLAYGNTLATDLEPNYELDTVRQIKLHFRFSKSILEEDYRSNAISLRELNNILIHSAADSISIVSTASPEGILEYNELLADKRSQAVRKYILEKYPNFDPSNIETSWRVTPWAELLPWVEADSSLPYKDRVVEVINRPASLATTEWRLKQIGDGRAWRYIEKKYLQRLRTGDVSISLFRKAPHETIRIPEPLIDSVTVLPDAISNVELQSQCDTIQVALIPASDDDFVSQNPISSHPFIAVKTNLLELAAGVANIGIEFRLSKHLSLDLPFTYSPYTISQNYRLRVLVLRPELRYWFRESFNGHFIGLHATGWIYNVSFNSSTRYQSNRMAYGAGVSYGCVLALSTKWCVEFNIGAGYMNTAYDCYRNVHNGTRYDSCTKNYWGITKASVGIVYLINRNRR